MLLMLFPKLEGKGRVSKLGVCGFRVLGFRV